MLSLVGLAVAALGVLVPSAWLTGDATEPARLHGLWLFRGVSVLLAFAAFALDRATRGEERSTRDARILPWSPLVGILAVALGLRLIGLGSELWYDEVVTLTEFVRLPARELLTTYTVQNNHILYSLLARLSVAALGETPLALRLPAALFGVASVAAVFLFGRRLASDREALLATALVAVSYHHVWFSQNARGYTGLMLFGLVASALFLDGLRSHARRLWIRYALAFAAAMHVHLSAVFLFLSHGLLWLGLFALRDRPSVASRYPGARTLWPLVGLALGGLLTLELYALILPQMVETFGATAADATALPKVSPWRSPLWMLGEILRRLPGGAATAAVALPALGLAGWAWLRLARRDPAAAGMLVLPFPLTLGALLAAGFHVWPRYFFQYMGFGALLLVTGCFGVADALAHPPGRARRLATWGVAALGLASTALLPANYARPKQAFGEARRFVEERRAPGDIVVTAGLATLPYERLYAPDWTSVSDADELSALESGGRRVWLVYSFPTYMKQAHPDILAAAEARYETAATFPGTLGDGTLFVLRRRSP